MDEIKLTINPEGVLQFDDRLSAEGGWGNLCTAKNYDKFLKDPKILVHYYVTHFIQYTTTFVKNTTANMKP